MRRFSPGALRVVLRRMERPMLAIIACLLSAAAAAATPEIRVLDASITEPAVADVISGALDSRFTSSSDRESTARGTPFWLKIGAVEPFTADAVPVLSVHTGRSVTMRIYASDGAPGSALPGAVRLPEFGGARDTVFILPAHFAAGRSLYAWIDPAMRGTGGLRFSMSTLDAVLGQGAARERMIVLAFGALMAMALAGFLIWLVLSERLFILYSALFCLQALYIAYLSGQGFDWPVLSYAAPLGSYAWNVPVALSGAAACLFAREIADLRRFSPRVYTVFGWLAAAFVVLTFANLGKLIGLGVLVNTLGNILFLGSSVFTLVVSFIAWRRGSRAAGWFFIAWALLEAFTIATTIQLLLHGGDERDRLLYYGLPLSMVAAAVLIALGLADRLREQRVALTDAERRAQTDSLTGVLNRRSLVERLDAACLRAQARGLPISLLFIDLDHFKEINDSFGHPAGDACLGAIIAPIQAELRQSDVIGRYGGEEFVVILSSADSAAARPIAQRILERVASVRVEGFGEPISLTCSIGMATSDMLGVWGEHLIARADEAVYAAKRSGRNRVQIALPMAA
ncbi:MAG: sensor domain-containing diguanylate cyclase [Steroidobacteraceae bacterium]